MKKVLLALCAVALGCGVMIGVMWDEQITNTGVKVSFWIRDTLPKLMIPTPGTVRTQPAACERPAVPINRERAQEAIRLLALNIYFHSGHLNTQDGKKAITAAVFNRMHDCTHNWPRSVRGVINAGKERGTRCDWSWRCDGRPDVPEDPNRYAKDYELARRWFNDYLNGQFGDPIKGATWVLRKDSPFPRSWPDDLVDRDVIGQYRFFGYPR